MHHFCAREKWLQPIKGSGPRSADKGDGWLAHKMRCRCSSIRLRFFCAAAPQSMKATGRRLVDTCAIRASVRVSQPWPWWLLARPSSTVKQVFRSKVPCCAHATRLPPGSGWTGQASPRSRWRSLKILRSDGGTGWPGATENANPSACPRPWYGSWPRMTVCTVCKGVNSKARSGCGGNTTTPSPIRRFKKASKAWPCWLPKNWSTVGCQSGATGQSQGSAVCKHAAAASSGNKSTALAEQSGQGQAGVWGAHKSFAYQKRIHTRSAHT